MRSCTGTSTIGSARNCASVTEVPRRQRVPGWQGHTAWLAEQPPKLDPGVLELAVQDGDISGAIAQAAERIEKAGEVDR
jgi:hypothetical protein